MNHFAAIRIGFFGLAFFWAISGCSLQAAPGQAGGGTAASTTNALPRATARKVDIHEFERLAKDRKNVVLDVRTDKEFAAGHIPGALNLNLNGPDFEKKVSALNRERTYLVHCAAGVRSARACETMSRLGFTNLVDLPPGFKEWQKAGKPIQK